MVRLSTNMSPFDAEFSFTPSPQRQLWGIAPILPWSVCPPLQFLGYGPFHANSAGLVAPALRNAERPPPPGDQQLGDVPEKFTGETAPFRQGHERVSPADSHILRTR